MAPLKNSMMDDLKTARENMNDPKPSGGDFSGVLSENEPVDIEAAPRTDTDDDADVIQDEYEGNISYEKLKSESALGGIGDGENGTPNEAKDIGPENPDATAQDAGEAGGEKGKEKEVAEIVSDLDHLDNEFENEKFPETGSIKKDMLVASKEITAKMGRKRMITVLLVIVILVGVTAYALKHKNSPGARVVNSGNQMTNIFTADISKVKNENDATRIKNINIIAQAVVVYHLEKKADFPVSENYIKLNEVNPVTDLFKTVLKEYNKPESLLLDPSDPGYYYTYRSLDGQNIEFGVRMEDLSSIDCGSQDPCIYRKSLTESDIQNVNLNIDQYKQSL